MDCSSPSWVLDWGWVRGPPGAWGAADFSPAAGWLVSRPPLLTLAPHSGPPGLQTAGTGLGMAANKAKTKKRLPLFLVVLNEYNKHLSTKCNKGGVLQRQMIHFHYKLSVRYIKCPEIVKTPVTTNISNVQVYFLLNNKKNRGFKAWTQAG